MKVLGVSGSLTPQSHTAQMIDLCLAEAARYPDVEIASLNLGDIRLDFCDGRAFGDYEAETQTAVNQVVQADVLIVGTPIYRGSYTGALKNLLDLVPNDPMAGKVVGLVATGGSDHHYLAIDQELRPLFSFFQCLMVPATVYARNLDFADDGLLSRAIQEDIQRLVKQMVVVRRGIDPRDFTRTYPAIRRKPGDK